MQTFYCFCVIFLFDEILLRPILVIVVEALFLFPVSPDMFHVQSKKKKKNTLISPLIIRATYNARKNS